MHSSSSPWEVGAESPAPAKPAGAASSQPLRVSVPEPRARGDLGVQLAQGPEGSHGHPRTRSPDTGGCGLCSLGGSRVTSVSPQHWGDQRHPHPLSQRGEPAPPPNPLASLWGAALGDPGRGRGPQAPRPLFTSPTDKGGLAERVAVSSFRLVQPRGRSLPRKELQLLGQERGCAYIGGDNRPPAQASSEPRGCLCAQLSPPGRYTEAPLAPGDPEANEREPRRHPSPTMAPRAAGSWPAPHQGHP